MRHIIYILILTLQANLLIAQNSYSLQKALQTAKVNNQLLKAEYYNVNIAKSDIVTASLRPNPVLNNQTLQLAQPSEISPNTKWYNNNNRQVWWQLTKTFQLPSQRLSKIDFANNGVKLAENNYIEIERNVFQSVAEAWLKVWTIDKQMNVLKQAKDNVDSLVFINKLRLKNQVITPIDLARTELLSNQYAVQIKAIEQNYKNELANLKFLIGVNEEISVDTKEDFSLLDTTSLDSLLQFATQERGDILSLKSNINLAESNISLQKSMALPQPELGVIWNPQNSVPYVGIFGTIEIPILSRNQGEIQKSTIIKQQAEQQLNVTKLNLINQLTIAFNSYNTQKQILENNTKLLSQATYILGSVKYAYLRGGTTIIDYFEAERSWLNSQQQYYDALQEFRLSNINLLYASGLINKIAQ